MDFHLFRIVEVDGAPSYYLKQWLNEASLGLGFIILANHASSLLPAEFLDKLLDLFSCFGLSHGYHTLPLSLEQKINCGRFIKKTLWRSKKKWT